jgi:hypothetical protein
MLRLFLLAGSLIIFSVLVYYTATGSSRVTHGFVVANAELMTISNATIAIVKCLIPHLCLSATNPILHRADPPSSFEQTVTSRKLLTNTAVLVGALLVPIPLLVLSYAKWHIFREKENLLPRIVSVLDSLAREALASEDAPISAVVIYNEKIIGQGYDAVMRTGNVGSNKPGVLRQLLGHHYG